MISSEQLSFDSTELYHACQSDNEQTRLAAYEVLWAYLYRVALKVVYDQTDAQAVAQDCAQTALIRIHQRFSECHGPASFRAWARQITSRIAIDHLRRQRRLIPLGDNPSAYDSESPTGESHSALEMSTFRAIGFDELQLLINQAPISDRSRRVVLGRYFDSTPDENLARIESQMAKRTVLPSHIQVTRAKNIAKLRTWEPLQIFWKSGES